jgi:hypothetical protein
MDACQKMTRKLDSVMAALPAKRRGEIERRAQELAYVSRKFSGAITMLTHEELKQKVLKHPEVKTAYDAEDAEFSLLDALLKARVDADLPQADVATQTGIA